MTLLKFIEKEPKFIMMEEMYERLKKEPERQWEYLKYHATDIEVIEDTPQVSRGEESCSE